MPQASLKREQILKAGADVMHRQGYNGTGVKDIVAAAGIPKGSFYNYFDSKEAFAAEAVAFAAAGPLREFEQILQNPAEAPLQRILSLFRGKTEEISRQGEFCAGCFIGNLCQEMADSSQPIAREVDAVLRRHQAALAECLREARRAGELPEAVDVEQLAEFIFNSWEGAIMRMKANHSAGPLRAFTAVLETSLLA